MYDSKMDSSPRTVTPNIKKNAKSGNANILRRKHKKKLKGENLIEHKNTMNLRPKLTLQVKQFFVYSQKRTVKYENFTFFCLFMGKILNFVLNTSSWAYFKDNFVLNKNYIYV